MRYTQYLLEVFISLQYPKMEARDSNILYHVYLLGFKLEGNNPTLMTLAGHNLVHKIKRFKFSLSGAL